MAYRVMYNCEIPTGCRLEPVYSYDQEILRENFKTKDNVGILCDLRNRTFAFQQNKIKFQQQNLCDINIDDSETNCKLLKKNSV